MDLSIAVGNKELSLSSVSTAVSGTPYFIHRARDGFVGYSYEPGANKPTAISIVFETSPNNTAWTIVDTIVDPSKQQARKVQTGSRIWVRLRILSITIGGGDPLNGYIFV